MSIDVYGYTKIESEPSPTVKHIVSCSSDKFAEATSYPSSGFPHIESLRAVALCSFNPNGVDGTTDGITYLYMTGYLKKLSDIPSDIGKYVLSGTLGGGLNQSDNNFVFKGSFGTVAKPTTP